MLMINVYTRVFSVLPIDGDGAALVGKTLKKPV